MCTEYFTSKFQQRFDEKYAFAFRHLAYVYLFKNVFNNLTESLNLFSQFSIISSTKFIYYFFIIYAEISVKINLTIIFQSAFLNFSLSSLNSPCSDINLKQFKGVFLYQCGQSSHGV